MIKSKIHFILTGGTIDSFAHSQGYTSFIPYYIQKLQPRNAITFTSIFSKVSDDITKEDRSKLLSFLDDIEETKIIISHGTDTMTQSAMFVKQNQVRKDQTIIFTGSFIPLGLSAFSDAPFNLGFALADAQILSPGVYICMNGKIFEPGCVKKNYSMMRFEESKC